MKKFLASFLLVALMLPSLVAAQSIPILYNTGVQPQTLTTILTNQPGSNGLVTDVQQLRLRINQLFALLNTLYALLKARNDLAAQQGGTVTPVDDGTDDVDNSNSDTVNVTNKAKLSLQNIKSHYVYDEAFGFKIKAEAVANGGNTLSFTSGCQVRYKLYREITATPYFDSSAGTFCTQSLTSVNLPAEWTLNYDASQKVLAEGTYRLEAEVIGVGTLSWYFKVQKPLAAIVTLTSPTVNQAWAPGSTHTVTWTTANAEVTNGVEIWLGSYSLGVTTNTGSKEVTVPANIAPGTYPLTIHITATGGSTASTPVPQIAILSDVAPTDPPVIDFLSAYSGLSGSSVVISGRQFTNTANDVTFGAVSLGTLPAVDSKITITVPASLAPGTYAIKVVNGNGTSNTVNFVINTAPVTPVNTVITVTSPVGDTVEEWSANSIHTITWTTDPSVANGGASAVNVKLVDSVTNLTYIVASGIANTGSYTWQAGKLANGTSVTGKYRLRVCPVGAGECDKSNKSIKIIDDGAKTSLASNSQLASTAAILQGLIEQLNSLLRLR